MLGGYEESKRFEMMDQGMLVRRLEAVFSEPGMKPVRERDLVKVLGLGAGERGALRAALRDLQDRGVAAPSRGGRWSAASRKNAGLAEGVFRVRANGTCWLVPDSSDSPLLRIRPDRTGAALNGDRVQVQPEVRSAASARMFGHGAGEREDVRWAQVTKVLERRRTAVVGVLRTTPYYAYLVPWDPLLPSNVRLEGGGDVGTPGGGEAAGAGGGGGGGAAGGVLGGFGGPGGPGERHSGDFAGPRAVGGVRAVGDQGGAAHRGA